MTDRPIIFSGPMVKALLDGRKTQTRRLATSPLARCTAGDRLYVREAHAFVGSNDPGLLVTRADYPACVPRRFENVPPETEVSWRPSIHMPRWASRLTLIVDCVRVQSLQDISRTDAIAEGFAALSKDGTLVKYGLPDRDGLPGNDDLGWHWEKWQRDPGHGL